MLSRLAEDLDVRGQQHQLAQVGRRSSVSEAALPDAEPNLIHVDNLIRGKEELCGRQQREVWSIQRRGWKVRGTSVIFTVPYINSCLQLLEFKHCSQMRVACSIKGTVSWD